MNKNLLSENMLRFGTKNLSEGSRRNLTLESIMQTIAENGLKSAVMNRLLTEDEAASTNQIATPNYWFSNSYNNGGDGGGKNYNIECPEKAKVTSHVTGLEGQANRTQVPVQCYIPNSVKGAANISEYFKTGKVGDKVYFDPTKGQAQQTNTMQKAPIWAYSNSVDMPSSKYIAVMSAKKSYFSGKDKYGKPYAYGVNAEGVTNLWDLICKILEKLHG